MGWGEILIEIAIPGCVAYLMIVQPPGYFRTTGYPSVDEPKANKLRRMGYASLALSAANGIVQAAMRLSHS
jgi:hypothetical protein